MVLNCLIMNISHDTTKRYGNLTLRPLLDVRTGVLVGGIVSCDFGLLFEVFQSFELMRINDYCIIPQGIYHTYHTPDW